MDKTISMTIEKVATKADSLLWEAFDAARNDAIPSSGIRMIFPRYADGTIRVSEQEARFFFVHALEESPFLYSVETPTEKLYKQSGADASRASFDITVRDHGARPIANCEFKFGGISPNRKERKLVAKDLEKLLRDPGDGLWFHLLEAVDNSTLSNILRTIEGELTVLLDEHAMHIQPKTLTVHICILRHGFSIHRDFALHPELLDRTALHEAFSFAYKVTRNELIAYSESQGWRICRRFAPREAAHQTAAADY
jgi:hypothetical protein